eukprot:4502005-Prorocentrum_lima.AAC.1
MSVHYEPLVGNVTATQAPRPAGSLSTPQIGPTGPVKSEHIIVGWQALRVYDYPQMFPMVAF